MLNIVLVEDHKDLRESLVEVMTSEGHHATAFNSAEALWTGCSLRNVDIVVLDLNLPGEDGISVARRLRAEYPAVGIVMLTARSAPDDRRVGYETGADIYLTKPSSIPELTSSILALARRLQQNRPAHKALVLDMVTLALSGPEGTIALSASEAELLAAFARAANNRLKINEIANMALQDGQVSKAAIEVRIVRLRKKLSTAGALGQPINVVRNYGYQLSARIDIV